MFVSNLLPAELASSAAVAEPPATRALCASSRAAYAKDIQLFQRFGGTLPCDAVALMRYAELMRNRVSPRTLFRRLMAVQHWHVDAGLESPTQDPKVRNLIRWLQVGKMPTKTQAATPAPVRPRGGPAAKPMTRALLERVLDAMGRNPLDRRDRALLLLGFAAGLKRSQLVALDVRDLRWTPDAMLVTLRTESGSHSKGPRVLSVQVTGGPMCAGTAVRQYVDHLALEPELPLFRAFNRGGDPTESRLAAAFVNEVVKRRLRVIGVDPQGHSGESLRQGRRAELSRGLL